MKFFYIGRFDRPYATENYVAWALQSLGHTVVKRPYTCTASCNVLLRQARKASPDVVLFSKVSSPHFTQLITEMRRQGILTVTWLWDLYFGYRRSRPPQMKADLVFSTDGGHPHCWTELGTDHHVLRQGVHEPEHVLYPTAADNDRYDLAFIGSPASYPARTRLTARLGRTYGARFKVFSHGLRGLALNQELAKARIVIGDSYPATLYWSNRIYEILGRGGFLLHPQTPGLEAEFIDGEHYVGYPRDDHEALKHLIDKWLADDEGRERIRQAGFTRASQFTYTVRCLSLIEQVQARVQQCSPAEVTELPLTTGNPSSSSWNHEGPLPDRVWPEAAPLLTEHAPSDGQGVSATIPPEAG